MGYTDNLGCRVVPCVSEEQVFHVRLVLPWNVPCVIILTHHMCECDWWSGFGLNRPKPEKANGL